MRIRLVDREDSMKFNRTQKILSCLLMSLLALQASMFFNAKPAEATGDLVWSEITPRNSGDTNYDSAYGTIPAMGNATLQYGGHKSYGVSTYTSITDLVETKITGSKVYHFFLAIPYSNYAYNYGMETGHVYHCSSENNYTWVKINPTDWGSYGGAINITVKAIPQTWTDASGSQWNKKLFMFCNNTDWFDYNYNYYAPYKATFYRYDGNGSSSSGWVSMVDTSSSAWRYSLGSYYSACQKYKTHYARKAYFEYVDPTNDGVDNGTVYLIAPYSINFWGGQWRLRVLRYTGSSPANLHNDLINNPNPPRTAWTAVEIPVDYRLQQYNTGYPVIFDLKKVDNYLFFSTCGQNITFNYWNPIEPHKEGTRLFYRYDTTNNTVLVPDIVKAPLGHVQGTLQYDGGRNMYYFNVRIEAPGFPLYYNWCGYSVSGGQIYRAYVKFTGTRTLCYRNYYGSDYPMPSASDPTYYNSTTFNTNFFTRYVYPMTSGYAFRNGFIKFTVTPGTRNDTTRVMDLDAILGLPHYGYYMFYQRCRLWSGYDSYTGAVLDKSGTPAPISLEYFNGYLYGGYPNGELRRTNVFNVNTVIDSVTWPTMNTISALNHNSQTRTMTRAITSLGKTTKKNALGQEVDLSLLIGGEQQSYYYGTGEGVLFSTNGGNTPLSYSILEDQWEYYDMAGQGYGYIYGNTIYDIYDIYQSSLGLIVSFNSNRLRTNNGGGFGYRFFHLMNAKPTCKIEVSPDPVINERGSDSDICFTFTPKGGFGSGNVQVYLGDFPINVYLPKKDVDGNLINTQISDNPLVIKSVVMNGGQITVCGVIRSTRSAVVGTYKMKITIVDLETGWESSRIFTFMIVYPKPGFSERVSPSTFDLYQGDPDVIETTANIILKQYCNEETSKSSQEVTVDIESRNDFEENVVVGLYWLTEPPSQDITAEWKDSPFIYDYIDSDTVEVITRKNISTRYSFIVKVTPNTSVGVWKLKLFFLSGTIKHFKTVTINVLRAKPCLEITSIPKIIRVVPGANAQYRIQVKSIDYDGKVALSLANVPPDVEVFQFHAENPPPGYADNYVELTSGSVAYAVLELRTYAITIDPYPPNNVIVTNMTDTKNVISWDGSKQGTNPVAGYEIWRGLSQYTDKAQQLGTVPATTTQFDDDNFDRTRTYYYFVRSFDNQTPPNYSEWAQSDPFKLTATEEEKVQLMASVIPHDGSAPGRFDIYVIGQGVGYSSSEQQQTTVCAVGTSMLQIYDQIDDMATPFLNTWGWFIILLSMILAFYVVSKRVDLKKPIK